MLSQTIVVKHKMEAYNAAEDKSIRRSWPAVMVASQSGGKAKTSLCLDACVDVVSA